LLSPCRVKEHHSAQGSDHDPPFSLGMRHARCRIPTPNVPTLAVHGRIAAPSNGPDSGACAEIDGAHRVALHALVSQDTTSPAHYLPRLPAYGLIIAAIVHKNRKN